MWGPALVMREAQGVGVALLSPLIYAVIPGRDIPPLGSRVGVPRTRRTRARARVVSGIGALLARPGRRRIDQLRANHGLPPLAGSVNEVLDGCRSTWWRASPSFDLNRHALPPGVRYVGPLLWHPSDPPGTVEWLDTLPGRQALGACNRGHLALPGPLPLSCGGGGPGGCALRGDPHHRPASSGRDLGAGANIHVRDWLAHDTLLPRCSALVTTGVRGRRWRGCGRACRSYSSRRAGTNRISRCAWSRPAWQYGFAAALHARGLRAAVAEVLGDPRYRENARESPPRLLPHRGRAARRTTSRCWRTARGRAPATGAGVRLRERARMTATPHVGVARGGRHRARPDGAGGERAVRRGPAQLPPGALPTAPPAVQLIAKDGFGDPRNIFAWSMAHFRGRIYVGTGRQVVCVENQTIDFFLRVSDRYVTDPLPGATCPADPYDMDLRAEIWEYTPRTGKWRRVYRSRADVPNPRARRQVRRPRHRLPGDDSLPRRARPRAALRRRGDRRRVPPGAQAQVPAAHPLDPRRPALAGHAGTRRGRAVPYGVFRPMGLPLDARLARPHVCASRRA